MHLTARRTLRILCKPHSATTNGGHPFIPHLPPSLPPFRPLTSKSTRRRIAAAGANRLLSRFPGFRKASENVFLRDRRLPLRVRGSPASRAQRFSGGTRTRWDATVQNPFPRCHHKVLAPGHALRLLSYSGRLRSTREGVRVCLEPVCTAGTHFVQIMRSPLFTDHPRTFANHPRPCRFVTARLVQHGPAAPARPASAYRARGSPGKPQRKTTSFCTSRPAGVRRRHR